MSSSPADPFVFQLIFFFLESAGECGDRERKNASLCVGRTTGMDGSESRLPGRGIRVGGRGEEG